MTQAYALTGMREREQEYALALHAHWTCVLSEKTARQRQQEYALAMCAH